MNTGLSIDIGNYWSLSKKKQVLIQMTVAPVVFYAYDPVETYLVVGMIIIEDSYYHDCPDCCGHDDNREVEVWEIVNARSEKEAVKFAVEKVLDDEATYRDLASYFGTNYRWRDGPHVDRGFQRHTRG